MEHSIKYGTRTIRFTIIKSDRTTFGVTVYPDRTVIVLAPEKRTTPEIIERFRKKLPWVTRYLDYFEKIIIPTREKKYISGETHYYLGKQYRLKVISSVIDKVSLQRGYITVYTKQKKDTDKTKKMLTQWYKDQSIEVFAKQIKEYQPKFAKYGIADPDFCIRTMQTKWGSCSRKGMLTLNSSLIINALPLIRYVIIHELCHLVYFNHTKDFYTLLSRIMPEWKKNKAILDHSEF